MVCKDFTEPAINKAMDRSAYEDNRRRITNPHTEPHESSSHRISPDAPDILRSKYSSAIHYDINKAHYSMAPQPNILYSLFVFVYTEVSRSIRKHIKINGGILNQATTDSVHAIYTSILY